MKAQFALCAQSASIDRATNRVSIFNVVDHIPASNFPLTVPAIAFVSVIESNSSGEFNVKGTLEIETSGSSVGKFDVPINFSNGRLARIVVNINGLTIRNPGPVTFRLTIPNGVAAETTFQAINVQPHEALAIPPAGSR